MKTLFKNMLVLAVMLGTYTSFANARLEVLPTFNNVKKGNLISVTDAKGSLIFSGQINFDGNIRNLYDFSQLSDGVYIIEVEKDFEIEVSTVEVKDNSVNFVTRKKETIFKPVIRVEKDVLLISKLALNNKEMEVELYYENELLSTEVVKGEQILNRVYKLDKTFRGHYTTIIKSNGRTFIKNFEL